MEIKIIETVTITKETSLIDLLQLEADVIMERINKLDNLGTLMIANLCGERAALLRVIDILKENELILK